MYEIVAFYLFAALTISFFAIAVFSKNALYAMSSLAAGMIFIAGFFFLLDAEFLGVVQIVVYTGAVMALYAFGMMFFDTTRDVKENIVYKKIIYSL
ncbi:MAG: NADH-quinone oxidoreductase subunit J, partial [Campylobacteraceae bacterium]|nr:NADH-quinone oxidoreductase subunit J [Campylobacteraceae bacterium]